MRFFFDHDSNSFYIDAVNDSIPHTAIEITQQQHHDLYAAINAGCVIFEDLSYSEPRPSQFHEWDGQQWVKNFSSYDRYIIEQNQTVKNSLISAANEQIAVLLDIIDLDMQSADEERQLKQWKKYRILLTRIDANQTEINWPEKPE